MVNKDFYKKYNTLIGFALSIVLLSSCGIGSNVKFIEKDGHKQYKKESGKLAQAEWVTIKGNEYYFDMNGYLQTEQWLENEYYVDSTGKKLVKAWYTDKDGKTYYLSSNGKYLRGVTATIDGKDYYFDKGGVLAKDKFFFNEDEKYMHANADGMIDKPNNLINIEGETYFIDDKGLLFTNGWKEIEKVNYYFNDNGKMVKNSWVDATYYVDADGKMLRNTTSPEGYELDKEGKVLEQYKNKLLANDFKYLYLKYCDDKWAECGSDGSFISIDTNPGNYDSSDYRSSTYLRDATGATKSILKDLGFPDYVYKSMEKTTSLDGKQKEVNGDVIVTWSYRPGNGLEVMFMKKRVEE